MRQENKEKNQSEHIHSLKKNPLNLGSSADQASNEDEEAFQCPLCENEKTFQEERSRKCDINKAVHGDNKKGSGRNFFGHCVH